MLVSAKLLFMTLAVVGIAATGATGVDSPMSKAIQVHEDHLTDTTMPDKSYRGQQNSYDRLTMAQERWLAGNHAMDDEPVEEGAIYLA